MLNFSRFFPWPTLLPRLLTSLCWHLTHGSNKIRHKRQKTCWLFRLRSCMRSCMRSCWLGSQIARTQNPKKSLKINGSISLNVAPKTCSKYNTHITLQNTKLVLLVICRPIEATSFLLSALLLAKSSVAVPHGHTVLMSVPFLEAAQRADERTTEGHEQAMAAPALSCAPN